jgi:hypothetical protein
MKASKLNHNLHRALIAIINGTPSNSATKERCLGLLRWIYHQLSAVISGDVCVTSSPARSTTSEHSRLERRRATSQTTQWQLLNASLFIHLLYSYPPFLKLNRSLSERSGSRKDVSTSLLTAASEWRLLLAMEVNANRNGMSVNEDRFWSSECVKMRDGDRRGGPNTEVQ